MMDHKDLARQLYETRKLRTAEEVSKFDHARRNLFSTTDPAVLSDLFATFDDSTERFEVMFGLVHDLESYDASVYLPQLARAIPGMLPQAKDWIETIHFRILNNEEVRSEYRRVISTLPERNRAVITNLLEELSASEPEFKNKVREVLK